jgi:hypothetical protein
MTEEPGHSSTGFRFGLRSLLLFVTGLCLLAGMFRSMVLVALLFTGVLAAQCLFFLVIQRLVNRIAGPISPADDSMDDVDT